MTTQPQPTTPQRKSLTKEDDPVTKRVQPNKMVYIDAEGVRYEIYMPEGTLQQVCELYEAKDWGGLSRFPKWGKWEILLHFPSYGLVLDRGYCNRCLELTSMV